MPTVRFQVTALSCEKTEDRGLLDVRNEDEVYIFGGVYAQGGFDVLLVGDPSRAAGTAFQYLSIKDGERIDLTGSVHGSWHADLPDGSSLVAGLAAYEEDAERAWPTDESLLNDLKQAVEKAVHVANAIGRAPSASDIAEAATGVMRAQERFQVDDFLGRLILDEVGIDELQPDNFDRSSRFAGGSRLLATDYDYTLYYRISRDDRDFAAELEGIGPLSLSLLPGGEATAMVTFRNTGRATFDPQDVVLVGSVEFAGWLSPDDARVTLTRDAGGVLLSGSGAGPGELLTFTLPITAPQALARSTYSLRLFIPSLKHFVPHEPVNLELSSGRNMVCEVQTIAQQGIVQAEILVVARDAETKETLQGTVKATGDDEFHKTSRPFIVQSNLRHQLAAATQQEHDTIVWPFGSVQVDGYWPQLVSLTPQ